MSIPNPIEAYIESPPLKHTPRLGSWELFPHVSAKVFIAFAGIGPGSLPVIEAVNEALLDYATRGSTAIPTWFGRRNALRARVAKLLNAAGPHECGLVTSTTAGILNIAYSLPWKAGDGVVVLRGEFPTNVTPWLQAAETFGLKVHWLDVEELLTPDRPGFAKLETLLQNNPIRLLAVSMVQFQTGHRMPIAALARLCHRHGAQIFVDAIQTAGIMPIDVQDGPLDYLAAAGQKYLMAGTEGSGIVYVRSDLIPTLVPRLAGWLSHEEPVRFLIERDSLRYDKPVRKRVDQFENSSVNTLSMAALNASLTCIQHIGVPQIFSHVMDYVSRLDARLSSELGMRSSRAPEPQTHSHLLAYPCPRSISLPALTQAINKRGVIVSSPDGHLRLSPHWPNNPDKEIDIVVETIREALRELGHERWPEA